MAQHSRLHVVCYIHSVITIVVVVITGRSFVLFTGGGVSVVSGLAPASSHRAQPSPAPVINPLVSSLHHSLTSLTPKQA